MGSFKFNDIKIESPYDIVSVLDIKMNHGVNIHSTLYLKLICEEYDDFQIFIKTNTKDFIKLSKFDNVIFNGLIESLEVSRQGNLYTLEIKAISATSLLDSKVESRSFQDINMLYSSVISTTISNIPQTIFAFNLTDKKIQEPLVQYNETAWEFLKRLASHFNSVLVCDIKDNKPRFYFGFNKKSTISIPQDLFYKANKDIESLNLSVEQLMDTDLFYHEVKTKEMYDLQDEVYFKNKKLYISHIKAEFIKSELIFTYRFSRINGIRQNKIYNENIKGASLEGKVIDSKDEFVKLHLNIDKKQDKTTAHWFKVGPISNNVFYLMFEKNTFARLYFPSNKEVEAEVKNSVRKNGSTCSLTKVPQNRYLTTKNNNQMSLKPSSIEFKSNTNLQLGILLEDPIGAKFYSHKNIKFDAVEDIRFYTKKNINIIALVSIRIYVPLSKQSLVIMNEFDLVGNIVFLEGRDRSVFDPFNDEPILTKKPFSWGKLIVGVVAGLIVVAGVSLAVFSLGTSLGFAGLALNALTFAIAKKGTQYVLGQAITDIRNQENSSDGIYAREAIIGCIVGGISYGTSKIPGGGIGVTLLEESASEFVHQSFRNVKYDEDKGWIAGYYIDYDKEEFLANVAISVVVGEVTDKALDKLNPFRDYFDTYIQNASNSSTNEITRMVSDNFKEIFKTGIETGIMLAYTDLNNTENISQKTQDTIKEAEDFTKETYIFVKTIIEKIQKIDYDKAFNNIGESAQEIAEKLQEIAEKLQDIDLLEVVENIQNMNPEEIKNLFENMNPEKLKKLFKNVKKEDKLIEEAQKIFEGEK